MAANLSSLSTCRAYTWWNPGEFPEWTSLYAYELCLDSGLSLLECTGVYWYVDPPVVDVTGFSLALRYDASRYRFNAAQSGPLPPIAVGGSPPPVTPGVGTQPFALLPPGGFPAGTPLPGSTLTYTDVGGVLTIDYALASPVSTSGPANFFVVAFDLIRPVRIDLSRSSVTYHTDASGADLGQLSFACTTVDGPGMCGSEHPAQSATVTFGTVPEPSSLLLLAVGAVPALARRSRAAQR